MIKYLAECYTANSWATPTLFLYLHIFACLSQHQFHNSKGLKIGHIIDSLFCCAWLSLIHIIDSLFCCAWVWQNKVDIHTSAFFLRDHAYIHDHTLTATNTRTYALSLWAPPKNWVEPVNFDIDEVTIGNYFYRMCRLCFKLLERNSKAKRLN
jgi:hypothetical protein